MTTHSKISAFILALGIGLGLTTLGFLLGKAALDFKQFERSVTVKGLSEQEYSADVVIWPIQFSVAENSLENVYKTIDANKIKIKGFLLERGIEDSEISFSLPQVTDKKLQDYGSGYQPQFRFSSTQTVTVYSKNVGRVRSSMTALSDLGKQGIVFNISSYEAQIEYIFTRLNEVKPSMIEEATRNARSVAQKFASDSDSKLGKIKRALQGRFSIFPRDKNNPHIKKVRVVSTVEYYLSD